RSSRATALQPRSCRPRRSMLRWTRSIELSADGQRELSAEPPVALQVPFAAHGLLPRCVQLDVEQYPAPPARRAGAGPVVVVPQATINVIRPADIGPVAAFPEASQHVHVAGRTGFRRQRFSAWHHDPPACFASTSTALSICGSLPAAYRSGKG